MDSLKITDKYQVIKALNKRNSVFLVEDRDNKLWVGKRIEDESIKIYKMMLNINNPNIARIKEMYNTDMGIVVIEEFINGQTIQESIEEGRLFSLYEVKKIMCQLCDGLKCIHSNSIIHRDISANNVIIDSKGNAKLIDLGISRIKSRDKSSDTYLMGTAGFAAPEQFGFRQTDERADIFSMGVLMNVMLTGELPVDKMYGGKFAYRRIIEKCLEMEPGRRYKNVTELKKCLVSLVTEKDNVFKAFAKELPGFRSHKWWKMLLTAAFCICLLLALITDCWIFSDSRAVDGILFIVFIITNMICPYLLAGNYKYYIERLPVVSKFSPAVRTFICFVLGICLMCFVFYIFTLIFSRHI